MNNKHSHTLSLVGGLVFLLFTQCSKKEGPPPVQTLYAVDYQFQVTGNQSALKIIYCEKGSVKKELNNPGVPWQQILQTFSSGDSVYLHITFQVAQGGSASWNWNVGVTQGTTVVVNDGDYGSFSNVPQVTPVTIEWAYKIP